MKSRLRVFLLAGLAAWLSVAGAQAAKPKKTSISGTDVKAVLDSVGPVQGFPEKASITKLGTLEADGAFFHIFVVYIKETQRYRTLVFDNNKNYLGYYETEDEPQDIDSGGIVFPSSDYTSGDADVSDSNVAEFTRDGPERTADLDEGTVEFVPAPKSGELTADAYRFIDVANRLAVAVRRKNYPRISADFSKDMLQRMPEQNLMPMLHELESGHGMMRRMNIRALAAPNEAIFTVYMDKGTVDARIALNADNKIIGLWFYPSDGVLPARPRHGAELRLPFRGQWLLYSAGESDGQPRRVIDQPHALRFMMVDKAGFAHAGNGRQAEDYFSFGKPVLAPADGAVAQAIEGMPDNEPGHPNPFSALGNFIVIQLDSGECAVLAHLKRGSIKVKPGDRVASGQPVAECGNSGDSSEPNIELQLRDGPSLQDGAALRCRFKEVEVDTPRKEHRTEMNYEPQKGELVSCESAPPDETSMDTPSSK